MDDFNSETDSDYTSYWRDWVSFNIFICYARLALLFLEERTTEIQTGRESIERSEYMHLRLLKRYLRTARMT